MSLREKLLLLESFGIDKVLCLRFDAKLIALLPQDFVKKILLDVLRTKFLLIGYDFQFGSKRLGNAVALQKYGREYGFSVEIIEQFKIHGQRVSSTLIRESLLAGDIKKAQAYLGRPYSVLGRVVHGDKRGRELKFPTANVSLPRKLVPLSGVYVIRVYGLAELPRYGVANVGFRPTINKDSKRLLEFYLLDFNQDIYGHLVTVEFLHRMRDEKKFASLELLRQQIEKDVEAATEFLQL
jgi:riboflavin kinase / FMN adenylyltransferase